MKSPKKLFISKPAIVVAVPSHIPKKPQFFKNGLYLPYLKYPKSDRRRMTNPYPASPSMNPKNMMKKIPINMVGLSSWYFGVANNSRNVRNVDAHSVVSRYVGGLSGLLDGVSKVMEQCPSHVVSTTERIVSSFLFSAHPFPI